MSQPELTEADTIRILVATDNHVGYEERDQIRKDDAWKTFDEIITLARTHDADMVLLGGDLFHDNKPSRKSMYQVMRTLRKNCLGMKPCELEFMSDANEVFASAFDHVNYEDQDINISIPVFSIHGNHDDPSGEGHFCSLDLLQVSGLVNYFGRIPNVDDIQVRPVLLQKGRTKLALYGLSNVRDERMFRTFRDHNVKWFRPNVQTSDWFNLLAVHQNHHAHTATSYLPENMLPEWLDFVVWGHEHECLIDPVHNPVTGFHVMQPGSSVATSLVPGEAVTKHVAILNITGKDFEVEKFRLKTVRPMVTREIVLASDKRFKGLDKKKENRQELTKRLMDIVEEMIEEANQEWESAQDEEDPGQPPLPLIRLKVEHTDPEGGHYEIENPQRFSNRFTDRVANTKDIVYFYKKKKTESRRDKGGAEIPEELLETMRDEENNIRVDKIVDGLLIQQSLKILPTAPFGDAVNQFVQKEDKNAMEYFVKDTLEGQISQMLKLDSDDADDLESAMEKYKAKAEQQYKAGAYKFSTRRTTYKPKPDTWDSDLDGHWEDQPEAIEEEEPEPAKKAPAKATRGRGRKAVQEDEDSDMDMDDVVEESPAPKPKGRGRAATTRATTAKAPARKPPARATRGRKAKTPFDDDNADDDVFMDDDNEDLPAPPPKRKTAAATTRSQPARSQPSRSAAVSSSTRSKQSTLNFSQKTGASQAQAMEISDDEISDDDDDAFEPLPAKKSTRRR